MKSSRWSVTVTPATHPTTAKVSEAAGLVVVTFRQRLPNGQFCRMRLVMSPDEAREFAYSILPGEPKFVPKV